jgi:endonuclease/exonuclease/phosphatase family metal-dependent hydrolase
VIRQAPLLVAVLLGITAAPAGAEPVTITTQNVRAGLSPHKVAHDVRQAARHSTIVLGQEFGNRHARRYAPPGWGTVHRAGYRRGDCVTFYDRSTWRLLRSRLVVVNHTDAIRAGHRFGLVAVLRNRTTGRRLATLCVHLITRAPLRPLIYRAGIARVHRAAVRLADRYPTIVGGDWNYGLPGDRARPRAGYPYAVFRGWGSRATVRRTTRLSRPDYLYWSAPTRFVAISRVGPTYSDHDGARVTLRY